jgi:hypothetical protein
LWLWLRWLRGWRRRGCREGVQPLDDVCVGLSHVYPRVCPCHLQLEIQLLDHPPVVEVALLLLLLLPSRLLLLTLGPVPLSCVTWLPSLLVVAAVVWGGCLPPEVPPPEFFAGGPAGGLAGAPAGGGGLGALFLAGHRWKIKHPSLVAIDTCALSWQTTMSSMCE